MIEPLHRTNQLDRRSEAWRPPRFQPIKNPDRTGCAAAARRFVDLQAGSIWRDLSRLLPSVAGVWSSMSAAEPSPIGRWFIPTPFIKPSTTSTPARDFGYRLPDTTYFEGTRWPVSDAVGGRGPLHRDPRARARALAFLARRFRCLKPGGPHSAHRPVRGPLALSSRMTTGVLRHPGWSGCSRPPALPRSPSSHGAMHRPWPVTR